MQRILFLTFVSFSLLLSATAQAQSKAIYRSEADELVTIRSLSILPVFDNARGIYSRPIENHLVEFLKGNHQWEYREVNTLGPIVTPEELEQSESVTKQIAAGTNADAFIATSVVKGPAGISLKMNLFLKADNKLLAQESLTGLQSFDVASIQTAALNSMNSLLRKVPYSGVVLSRQGTRVTVNLGKKDGLAQEQVLAVIQIIKLNRHPKFHFLVSTEKEIIGQVRILKVEDTLSFGRIVTEKESGSIKANSKLGFAESVTYANTDTLTETGDRRDDLAQRPDGRLTYGDSPQEWLPKKNPTFGSVSAHFGLGQFRENVAANTNIDTSAPFYPAVSLSGELWLTPEWTIHAKLRQGIVSTDNPGGGSSLSRSLSSNELLFGYNLRLNSTLRSPKVEGVFGFSNYRMASDTDALSTKTYSGLKFGVGGSYPLTNNSPYSLGAHLHFMFKPKLTEAPDATGGGAENTVNSFGFFVDKVLSINLKAQAKLDFELYSTSFSGGGASSSSQKHTTLSGGVAYLF